MSTLCIYSMLNLLRSVSSNCQSLAKNTSSSARPRLWIKSFGGIFIGPIHLIWHCLKIFSGVLTELLKSRSGADAAPLRHSRAQIRCKTGLRNKRTGESNKQITSSHQCRTSRSQSGEATGTATIRDNGFWALVACRAAIMVDPVAMPSSVTITDRPRMVQPGGPHRNIFLRREISWS